MMLTTYIQHTYIIQSPGTYAHAANRKSVDAAAQVSAEGTIGMPKVFICHE